MSILLLVLVLTVPVLLLIEFDQWRVNRWARRVEGDDLYDSANTAIVLTGGTSSAVRVR